MSTHIEWQSEFNIGIQVIDEQHQHLIEIINTLAAEIETKTGDIVLEEYFHELVSYSEYHFQTEETFFGKYEYPERSVHLAAHADYRKTVQEFMLRNEAARVVADELLVFLEEWWVEHITGMDQSLRSLPDTA